MATAVGLSTVLGTAEETVYGTPVAPDRWYEVVSESLERQNQILQSNGLRRGRAMRSGARRVLSARSGSGDVTMEVATKGFGRWFNHMLGGTPTVTQQGVTTAWLHSYTRGGLNGKSLTVQKALADESGTNIGVFTFHGGKVVSWELSISVDQILQLQTTMDFEDVDTTTAYVTPTYDNAPLFHFAQASLSLEGTPVTRTLTASVTGNNALKTDSYFLGSGGLKAEPARNDFLAVTGQLSAEFLDLASFHNSFTTDAPLELKLEFVGANIAATHDERLTVTIPEVHLTGETPKVGGPDVIVQNVPYEAAYDGVNPELTIEYMTTDTAA